MAENDKLVSVEQKPQSLCADESKQFLAAVNKMALAKNIKLAEGTLAVWEECMLEDIEIGIFDFVDFVAATKSVIRTPLFNRVDYADIYQDAKDKAGRRRMKEIVNAIKGE